MTASLASRVNVYRSVVTLVFNSVCRLASVFVLIISALKHLQDLDINILNTLSLVEMSTYFQ